MANPATPMAVTSESTEDEARRSKQRMRQAKDDFKETEMKIWLEMRDLRYDNVNYTRNRWPGDSALHVAVRENNLDVVRYLVKRGADLGIKNKAGDGPLQASCSTVHRRMITFFGNQIQAAAERAARAAFLE